MNPNLINGAVYGQLMIFHTIAAEGSISAAARRLDLSVPAVSKSLKLLEEHIGVPLFRRTTRRIELTEAGEILRSDTQQGVQSLQQALERVRDLSKQPSGSVRITLARLTFHQIVQPVYAEFCERYPDIELEISINDGTVDILAEGFDLGIRLGDMVQEGMVARQLTPPLREGLYVSPAYVERYGLPQSPQELAQHRLIGYRFVTARRILPLTLRDQGHELTIHMPAGVVVNDIEVMTDATRRGLGIGRIFEAELDLMPDSKLLIPILQDYWRTYPPAHLYYLQNSQRARRVQVFIDFLLENARQAKI